MPLSQLLTQSCYGRDVTPRHAAALALVGWYLMVPAPKTETSPIGSWSHFGSYDTAKDCEAAKEEMHTAGERRAFRLKGYTPEEEKRAYTPADECITSDDPCGAT